MGNTATRNENHPSTSQQNIVSKRRNLIVKQTQTQPATGVAAAVEGEERFSYNKRSLGVNAKATSTVSNEEAPAPAQRPRQTSVWSLGSLSGRLNWSFSAARNSFRHRNKSTRKSLTSLQQRRSKTVWHRPLTNAIFSSHFKESSRNEQFHIEQLVAKGAFGVVFKVIDKQQQQQQQQEQQKHQKQQHSERQLYSKRKGDKGNGVINNDNKHNNSREQQLLSEKTTAITTKSTSFVYALKVLKKSKIIEEHSVQQIKDEADIQKLCGHHPFVVQQVDLWQNRHNLHILSEYVPNGELFAKIQKFSIDLARLYLAEIALAIDFLHNAGVIYRDAKPENILLTSQFHIKLTDFGLSKWLRLGATTNTMCGTLQYMGTN